jgi:Xaa-Pro aminopeptidase
MCMLLPAYIFNTHFHDIISPTTLVGGDKGGMKLSNTMNNPMSRINRLRDQLPQLGLSHFLVTHIPHLRYLTGYTGEEGHLLVGHDRAIFLCDFRFREQAENQIQGCDIITHPENLFSVLPKLNLTGKIGVESEHITLKEIEQLKKTLPQCDFIPTEKIVEIIASVKDPDEIESIRKAISISERAFTEVLDLVTEGVTERDLALEVTYRQMRYGAEKDAFDLIVASGARGALPHGTASDKKIQAGDLIVFDWGCRYNGYPSDITRMVVLGKATPRQKEIFQIVKEAQQNALDAVRTGVSVAELDKIARDHITQAGYGPEFGHPLGHGLGLDIHSFPRVTQTLNYQLPTNTVITIEPGIYIPGWGGVRLEEDVRITPNGADILTTLPRELMEVG